MPRSAEAATLDIGIEFSCDRNAQGYTGGTGATLLYFKLCERNSLALLCQLEVGVGRKVYQGTADKVSAVTLLLLLLYVCLEAKNVFDCYLLVLLQVKIEHVLILQHYLLRLAYYIGNGIWF
jgi:hypothetical protein